MRKVSYGNLLFHFDVCEPWALVVHFEREDAVLVGGCECGAVGCAVLRDGVQSGGRREDRMEGEAVEGGEHGEFELDFVVRWEVEAGPECAFPDGEGDGECLDVSVSEEI